MKKEKLAYTIKTRNIIPSNWVSGHPVRLFGIYLYTVWKVAKEGYPWNCNECFTVKTFEKNKMCDYCIIAKAKKLTASYKLKK